MTKSLTELLFDTFRRSRTWRYEGHWSEIVEDRCRSFSKEADHEFVNSGGVDQFMSTSVLVVEWCKRNSKSVYRIGDIDYEIWRS